MKDTSEEIVCKAPRWSSVELAWDILEGLLPWAVIILVEENYQQYAICQKYIT